MAESNLHRIGRLPFTDGIDRDVFEDADGRQFVEDSGELVAGQWVPPADEPATVEDEGVKLSIEEIPAPANHLAPCVICGGRPVRYLAVIPPNAPTPTRGAFPLCNDCAYSAAVLRKLRNEAKEF